MPGYTGYKPQFTDEVEEKGGASLIRDNRFYIPGKFIETSINSSLTF